MTYILRCLVGQKVVTTISHRRTSQRKQWYLFAMKIAEIGRGHPYRSSDDCRGHTINSVIYGSLQSDMQLHASIISESNKRFYVWAILIECIGLIVNKQLLAQQ